MRSQTGSDPLGYPLATPDKTELLELARKREFGLLAEVLGAYQAAFDEDFRREDWLFDAYEAFETTDPALTALLDEWCTARPQEGVAWAARGRHRYALGWAARGHASAVGTSPAQFAGMEREFSKADEDLRRALALNERQIVAHHALMGIALARGDEEGFAAAYARAVRVEPRSFRIRRRYLDSLLPRWGGSYQQMGAALHEMRPLFAANPKLRVLEGLIAWDRARSEDPDELAAALRGYSEALTFGPDPAYFHSRGRALARAKRYAEAVEDFDSALALRPQDADVLYSRARSLVQLDRVDEAAASISLALALDPVNAEYQKWRADATARLIQKGHRAHLAGSGDEALRSLERAAVLDPDSAPAAYWKGQVLIKRGQYDQALESFERAIRLDPRDFGSHRGLDWLLARRGEWERVIAAWDRFIALQPHHAQAHLERAGAYRHKGDAAAALADLETACRLGSQEACGTLSR